MSAREEILRRVRSALQDAPVGPTVEPVRYRTSATALESRNGERFKERLLDYRARVREASPETLRHEIEVACRTAAISTLAVPSDLPRTWIPRNVQVLIDEAATKNDLAQADAVLTGCALAIAQTGTIVLDCGRRQGPRILSLLPDFHLCVVELSQIVGLVPEAIRRLRPAAETGRPITFVSGPSATSDIEFDRVEGVHGPRTLEVVLCS